MQILALYCGRPKGYYEKVACNSEPGHGELKKAFPDVLKALRGYDPTCIEDNGKAGKGKAYRYIGRSDFYKAITGRKVLQFKYHRYGQEPFTLILTS